VALVGREVNSGRVYLPAMVFGLVAMGPSAGFGEKYGRVERALMDLWATNS